MKPQAFHLSLTHGLASGLAFALALPGLSSCQKDKAQTAPVAKEPTREDLRDKKALYDFLANRPLALIYENGSLVIDGAPPDVHKFIDGGWKANLITGERDRDAGGRQVALAEGVVAGFRFPGGGLQGSSPLVLSLYLKPPEDLPRQAVSIFLNEHVVSNLELNQGWHRYKVTLPQRVPLLPGENYLRLHFRGAGSIGQHRSGAAITRLLLGPASSAEPQQEVPTQTPGRTCSYGIGADARQALCATQATRWSYSLVPPSGVTRPVHLTFGYGSQTESRPAAYLVRVARDGDAEADKVVFYGRGEAGRWQEAQIDLSSYFKTEVKKGEDALSLRALRIDLVILPPGQGTTPGPESGPTSGAISWPRLSLAQGEGDPPQPPSAPVAPKRAEHLLLIAVDALRGDRLLSDKDATQKWPALRALLQGGLRVPMVTQGNYGLPAHASILSGGYPAAHRLVRDNSTLPEGLPLISEILQRAGFSTGLFSASGYVSERWGLSRGFDAYRNLVREGGANSSTEILRATRPWLETQIRAGRRVFLYLALNDPHAPYSPPAALVSQKGYSGPLRPPVTPEQLLAVKKGVLKLTPQDRAFVESLYDAEIAAVDAALGSLTADLTKLGVLDKTAIVLLGTHGEEFFDHGSVGHGHSLYQEMISVPLILSFPQRLKPGVSSSVSELVDVAPTALHLLGAAVPESMQGESLLPIVEGELAPDPSVRIRMPRAAFSQQDTQLRSLQMGRYKLIGSSGERLQLHDLQRDPKEEHDIAQDNPIALRALRNSLGLFHGYQRKWHKGRLRTPADLLPGFGEEVLGR